MMAGLFGRKRVGGGSKLTKCFRENADFICDAFRWSTMAQFIEMADAGLLSDKLLMYSDGRPPPSVCRPTLLPPVRPS